MILKKTGQIP